MSRLTKAQERTIVSLAERGRLPRRSQARTRLALRHAGLLDNDPGTGAYTLTEQGRAVAARISGGSARKAKAPKVHWAVWLGRWQAACGASVSAAALTRQLTFNPITCHRCLALFESADKPVHPR